MPDSIKEKLASLTKQVIKLRDKDGKPWHEIAGETGQAAGKCMLAYEFGHLEPSDVVTYKNEADLAKKVVRLRDTQLLSWGSIVARTDVGEQHLRTLYESEMGEGSTKGNRIGKGGRFPGGGSDPNGARKASKKAAPTKKGVAKKTTPVKKGVAKKTAPAKKAAGGVKKAAKASGGRKAAGGSAPAKKAVAKRPPQGLHPLTKLDFDALNAKLEGKTISVEPLTGEGKDRVYKVKTLRSLVDGTIEFADAVNGGTHYVKVEKIRKVGK